MSNTKTTEPSKTRPHTIRIGRLEAAIWSNEMGNGQLAFSVTFSRSYPVDDNGAEQWRRTHSFGSRDLVDLQRLLRSAEAYIAEQPV